MIQYLQLLEIATIVCQTLVGITAMGTLFYFIIKPNNHVATESR